MQEIKHIGVFQAAKMAAVLYLIISAVIVIPMMFIMMAFQREANPFGLLVLLLPLLYAILGFIFTAIFTWLYNVVAGMVGGLQVEIEQK